MSFINVQINTDDLDTDEIIQINTDDLDTDEIIEIIERRGYDVMMPGQVDEDVEALHRTIDEIHNLYYAFCAWKDGDKNERFESNLKKFFEITVDMKVV